MSFRVLVRLFVVLAVLLLLWGGLRFADRMGRGEVRAGDLLLEGWPVNDVASMDIESADAKIALARKDGRWVVTSHHGYWADFPSVAQALRTLSEAKVARGVPDGVGYLAEFGLDAQSETNRPMRLVCRDEAGKELLELWLGSIQSGSSPNPWAGLPGGRFVRVKDGPVLLTSDPLTDLRTRSEDWIRTELLSVSPDNVASVSVANLGEPAYTVVQNSDGQYQAAEAGPTEETEQGAAARLFGALQSLRCSRVADPSKTDDELGMREPGRFELKTKDGVLYSVLVGGAAEGPSGRYARLAVALDPAPEAPATEADERIRSVRDAVSGWTFELPTFYADSMLTPRGDVIRPKPPPTPSAPATGDTAEPQHKPKVSLDFLGEPILPVTRPGPYR